MSTKQQHPLAEAVLAHFGISIFDFAPGVALHSINKDGQPWFIAKDVCDALGYRNTAKALSDHVDPDERDSLTIRYGKRGSPVRAVVNESGLYSLIFRSNKPEAKAFRKWVTSVVLPAIRVDGAYVRQALESARAQPAPFVSGEPFNSDERDGRRSVRRLR